LPVSMQRRAIAGTLVTVELTRSVRTGALREAAS
jgi:hypothetical protein